MRSILISLAMLVTSLMAGEVAISGQQDFATSWIEDKFGSQPGAREAELKAVMKIKDNQEAAWREYVLARRHYAKAVSRHRRQELMKFAAGNSDPALTAPALNGDSPMLAAKLALKGKFDELYATLNEIQKSRADEALTPSECGR